MTEPTPKVKWDIIGPEIKNDMFYNFIMSIASQDHIKTILEIGASSGEGSTEAFILGKRGKSSKLFSIEACTERYDVLVQRYKDEPNFYPYNVSSVSLGDFPSKDDIAKFMRTTPKSSLAPWPVDTVMGWYDKDIEYIEKNKIEQNGIQKIKKDHNIDTFDMVLIDGSEFTGYAEFLQVYGAKFILLDDTRAFKNWFTNMVLRNDPNYILLLENNLVRNGFAIYQRLY
jgi:hypothetical protein